MAVGYLLKGVVIGFSIAAPVGPIGVLCIRRTLSDGRTAGLVSGMGAATADAVYGSIAGFGLTFVSSTLIAQQTWLRLAGGAFLIYLGVKTFLARPAEPSTTPSTSGLASAYASTFFLTLTNPMTILSFAAMFAGLGLAGAGGDYVSAAALVGGVFIGSALWWLILSSSAGAFRKKFNPRGMRWVNRTSGVIITGFGVVALLSAM